MRGKDFFSTAMKRKWMNVYDDKEIDPNLDYELMYKQLSESKKSYRDQLHSVIMSSVTLEFAINELVSIWARKIHSTGLEEWAERVYVSINNKLIALRFANLINENLFRNMRIILGIRNKFAHKIIFSAGEGDVIFSALQNAYIVNDFLKKLPNDAIKFQLLASECCCTLLLIMRKIDPSSVLDLEATEDTTFEKLE
jgi:hypothetical protein